MGREIRPDLTRVADVANYMGETPIWSVAEQALYWINVDHDPEILRWTQATGEVRRWPVPERNGGFVFKAGGGALLVLASGLYDFDFASGQPKARLASPLPAHFALHECALDRAGRFWVGSINRRVGENGNFNPGGGALFRLDGDRLTPAIENITCANGLAFSPDGRRLYFSDSPTSRCEVWDLDPATGAIANGRTFFELAPGEGFVDGATVDAEGGYWATIVYGGALRRYAPDGRLDLEVKLPFRNPTKVAFGGEDLRTLYVTSTAEAIGDLEVSSLDGGVFALRPGVAGCPEPLFAG
jgi:sugar lactone lactonase YvrE